MTNSDGVDPSHISPIPPDDLSRTLAVVHPDAADLRRVSMVGDTYTILASGADAAGRYCLVDMLVSAGGGPRPHRHDFEEMFMLRDGELAFSFRGVSQVVGAGCTVNIPANAPHAFKNISDKTAHMLCLCSPAGQEEFFWALGIPLESRTARPPHPTPEEMEAKGRLVEALLPRYCTEMVGVGAGAPP